jgi:pimeloyl-ACP methyl ester carboxylesterase
VPCETLNIPTRHGKTFGITSGNKSAPPLLLMHGAGSNSLIWAEDVIEYSRKYRVFAVDVLGEPGKSTPNRPARGSLAYVEWLEDLYSAPKINEAALICNFTLCNTGCIRCHGRGCSNILAS